MKTDEDLVKIRRDPGMWTDPGRGCILISMILLTEWTEQFRGEIRLMSQSGGPLPELDLDPQIRDVRYGDARRLTEILILVLGTLTRTSSSAPDIRIGGSDDTVRFSFDSADFAMSDGDSRTLQGILARAADWNPSIESSRNGITLVLALPSPEISAPLDIGAMATETGITIGEAMEILSMFKANARDCLSQLRSDSNPLNERFRAAHSLKGAGKTLRAPELTAAALAVERKIRAEQEPGSSLDELETAWNRIEEWLNTESARR